MTNQQPDQTPLVTAQEKASLSRGAREIRGKIRDASIHHGTWQCESRGISPADDLLQKARWISDIENPETDDE